MTDYLSITVDRCIDNPHLAKCPRCHLWHGVTTNTPYATDSLLSKGYPAERLVLCDKCEGILLEHYSSHEVVTAIRAHRERMRGYVFVAQS